MRLKIFSIIILGVLIAAIANLPVGADEEVAAADNNGAQADSVLMDVGEVLDDLLTPEPYIYQSNIYRDPFVALIGGEEQEYNLGQPSVDEMVVVGILWGKGDRFAMVETRHGRSLILRKGDPIRNGHVRDILQNGIEVEYSLYGVVQIIVVPVKPGVEDKDER